MAWRATPSSAWWSSARRPTRARFSSSAKTPTRRRRIISTSRSFTPRRSSSPPTSASPISRRTRKSPTIPAIGRTKGSAFPPGERCVLKLSPRRFGLADRSDQHSKKHGQAAFADDPMERQFVVNRIDEVLDQRLRNGRRQRQENAETNALAQPRLLFDSADVDQHRRDRQDKVGELCRPHAVHHGFLRSPHVAAVHISAL